MHAILNFYVFLWKNKTVFFFFLTLIPLMSFFYLQQNQQKVISIIEVKDYNLTNFKNSYNSKNVKVVVKENEIYTSTIGQNNEDSKARLQDVNNNIVTDILFDTLKQIKQDRKELSLKVASLLKKKQDIANALDGNKLKKSELALYQDNANIIEELYKKELKAFQETDLKLKSYQLDKNTNVTYLENQDIKFAYKFSLSILFALFIAVLLSAFRSWLNDSYDDELEIKRATGIKTMEGMPCFKKIELVNNKLIAGKLKVHSLTEVSRVFKYISSRDRKTFAVVSSVKNEGNSSLVYALAQHAAENGNKVLLLDMNLRNMELSIKLTKSVENWDITNKDFSALEEKTVKLTQNLDFLPALKDAKSLDILKTAKGLKALLKDLKSKYDYIFVDTTAVFSVNINNIDSVILAEAVDGVLLNYLANRTKKRILAETIDKINMSESNILGIITNNRYNPKLKDDLLAVCSRLEKVNKSMADNLRLKILKSYLLDEE